jgi:uncharacterized protein (TIGR03032 family)
MSRLISFSTRKLDTLSARNDARWRNPAQIASQWEAAGKIDPELLRYRINGEWWESLASTDATLLVTREYEHLIMALCVVDGSPALSFMELPHPSGLVVNVAQGLIHVASTRNPNQIVDLAPVTGYIDRLDTNVGQFEELGRSLVPIRSHSFPGCFYLHDLALIDGKLHANSVGQNVVVRLTDSGDYKRIWWPRCIEIDGKPMFGQNYIQLNSIAAGKSITSSYFSASTDKLSSRRPGHRNFPVDKRGVIFSGATREPIAWGLTRPHSARLHNEEIWVNNSGYGEFGIITDGSFAPIARLPGWTRGLSFAGQIAFVGSSRVIPRFSQYAPGLEVEKSDCGIHAVDCVSGRVLGSITWPYGNQIFAIELVPRQLTNGFPFAIHGKRFLKEQKRLFYTFTTAHHTRRRNVHDR